jgi:hypothetical protein
VKIGITAMLRNYLKSYLTAYICDKPLLKNMKNLHMQLSKKLFAPISILEISRLDEARAFRKAQFTNSKRPFEKATTKL